MARIHKRKLPSGEIVWLLTHSTEPNRQRFIAGRTYEEAREVLRQFNHQLALHGQAPKSDSVAAVIGRYLSHLHTNRRYGTTRRYARVLKTFHQCFLMPFHPEVVQLRQLRPSHLEEYKQRRLQGTLADEPENPDAAKHEQELRLALARGARAPTPKDNARFGWLGRKRLRQPVTSKTVNYELQVLQTFFRWAIAHNDLFLDPASTVERIRLPKRALPKFLTAEDLKKVFGACTADERRLFMTILLTGMRKGEVEHLTWSDVSFELGVIFIQEKPELGWKPKTDERLVPISPMLRDILTAQHTQRRSDTFVFPNEAGNRDTHILQKLQTICRRAGIKPATVHALRHSFGAHLRMAGANLADIGDLLGHKDLATTQIYAKVHQEHLRKVVSKLTPLVTEAAGEGSSPRLLPDRTPTDDDNTTE